MAFITFVWKLLSSFFNVDKTFEIEILERMEDAPFSDSIEENFSDIQAAVRRAAATKIVIGGEHTDFTICVMHWVKTGIVSLEKAGFDIDVYTRLCVTLSEMRLVFKGGGGYITVHLRGDGHYDKIYHERIAANPLMVWHQAISSIAPDMIIGEIEFAQG